MGTIEQTRKQRKEPLGRIDFLILTTMYEDKFVNPIFSVTINELQKTINSVQRPCIWKHLSFLIKQGYVSESGKFGKQKTYYITKDGQKLIENGGTFNE